MKEQLYLIETLKHRHGYYRNWWGPNRNGYTYDVNEAGKYTKQELEECCLNDGNYRLHRLEDVLEGKSGEVTTQILIDDDGNGQPAGFLQEDLQ